MELDATDRKLLNTLQLDAKITHKELAHILGFVKVSRTIIDSLKLRPGHSISCFRKSTASCISEL